MTLPLPPPIPLTEAQVRARSRVAKASAAAIWTLFALAVIANFVVALDEDFDLSRFSGLFFVVFLGSIPLWILMWLEYFRERPEEYSWVWAFLLMTGPTLGPLLFYYRIWKRRYEFRAI
jgi:hypothetical protein